ncbi:MAG: hypothetical protein H7A42_06975 [Chlamydiales bacterium]|nr:hypothetical protein [Chlamydiales bacterium]
MHIVNANFKYLSQSFLEHSFNANQSDVFKDAKQVTFRPSVTMPKYDYPITSGCMEGKNAEETLQFLISRIDEISKEIQMEAWISPDDDAALSCRSAFHYAAAYYPEPAFSYLCELLNKNNLLLEALKIKDVFNHTPLDFANKEDNKENAAYLEDIEWILTGSMKGENADSKIITQAKTILFPVEDEQIYNCTRLHYIAAHYPKPSLVYFCQFLKKHNILLVALNIRDLFSLKPLDYAKIVNADLILTHLLSKSPVEN